MNPLAVDLRDVAAGILAVALLVLAGRVATRLQAYRRQRQRASARELALGRRVVAELPTGETLVLFSEDDANFYYGDRPVDKETVVAVRVLINGAPIAAVTSTRHSREATLQPTSFADHVEGIARDRWDVAIETTAGTTLVECGAIRERVSQELARAIFESVRQDVERRNGVTTPSREHQRGD